MDRDKQRTLEQIADDFLWPSAGGLMVAPDPYQSVRHQSIYEVLSTMPDADYQKLKAKSETFFWFIPDWRVRGQVYPFPTTVYPRRKRKELLTRRSYSKVLYLSPRLEKAAWSQTLVVVAHELAHLVRGHDVHVDPDEYEQQEKEAWQTVRGWGFAKEERKHGAVSKWYASWDRHMMRKILAPDRSR